MEMSKFLSSILIRDSKSRASQEIATAVREICPRGKVREKFLSHDEDDRDDDSSLVVRIQSHPARLPCRGTHPSRAESWRETTRGCCAARGRDRVWWLPTTIFLLGFLVHAGRNEAIRKERPVVEPRARRGSARGSFAIHAYHAAAQIIRRKYDFEVGFRFRLRERYRSGIDPEERYRLDIGNGFSLF